MAFSITQAWSAAAATTHSFGSTPTSGNILLLAVNCDATVSTPSGWTLLGSSINNCALYLFGKVAGGSEPTSVTIVPAISTATVMALAEFHDILLTPNVTPVGQQATAASALSTGTTATTTQADTYSVALFGLQAGPGGDEELFVSGYSGGFAEQVDMDTVLGPASPNVNLAVATRLNSSAGTQVATATAYNNVAQVTPAPENSSTLIAPFTIVGGVAGTGTGWVLGTIAWGL